MAVTANNKNLKFKSWLQFLAAFTGIILLVKVSSLIRIRFDLTEDKRYTLSAPTKKILSDLKNDIYIQVFLDGEIPIPLKRLKRSVMELLDEFRIASGRKIDYEFINPSEGRDSKQRETQYQTLATKGLTPMDIRANDAEGGSSVKRIFPGMILNYNGTEVPVNFLNNSSVSYEENILHSVEGLEYEMIQIISTLCSDTVKKVAFIEGHGEIPEIETADITMNLARFFTIDRGIIGGKPGILDKYAAVVIAGPEKEFNESDKLVLDQYIMNGGKVIWLFDEVAINSDSLIYGSTVGLYRPLNIEDQLFRYGARVNPAIVQDLECQTIRLMVMSGGTRQQVVPAPWVYYPLLKPASDHPVTRNLNRVKGEFVNYIDTVGLNPAIRKTILLSTSNFSRTLTPPLMISLKEAESTPNEKDFNKSNLPVAVLLEGEFPSVFKNRMISNLTDDKNLKIMTLSNKTKMIVIADANIIRNEVRRVGLEETPLPLGRDKYTGQVFGNRDFIINCLNYLVDNNGIMELRSREIKLRLLSTSMIKAGKLKWQLINICGPVLFVILSGLLYNFFRKRYYTRY
ncbi:MAG: gliding motility-associated ABC transporter substrate-binding protein GldG [Bacteroidetes bacterium]|nr:MAG: gliding motility-associated ABC transporter substrate-binding protein GldG [Bacteroidota bacterium]